MKPFYVVIYDFHSKSEALVVPSEWIYPDTEPKKGVRRYIYYNSDKEAKPPSVNMVCSFLRETPASQDEIKDGYVYPGIVLNGYGEFLL
jgi:hypothetical protein